MPILPRLATAARTGAEALRANPARSLLATLGVVIGAAALVAVLAVGDGVERFARSSVSREGYDAVVARPLTERTVDGVRLPRPDTARFGPGDVGALAAALGSQARVALVQPGLAVTPVGTAPRPRAVRVQGVVLGAPDTLGRSLAAGRHLTPEETRAGAPVAVVNAALARAVRGDTAAGASTTPAALARALGDSVRLGTAWVRIVGVAAATPGATGPVVFELVAPHRVVTPALVATRIGPPSVPMLVATAARAEEVPAVRAAVERWLDAREPGWRDRYHLEALGRERLAQLRQGMLVFKILMGSFTGITLVVGGIGIMNVLLASVAERTREIGVRKAVGARRRDILLQFLAESVTITAAGGAVGTAVGLGAAYGITAFMRSMTSAQVYAATTATTLLVSAGVAVFVGLAFGCYPALRAARLAPITAIHTE